MKCPYCNSELIRVAPIASRCPNPDCPTMKQKMPNNIWQDLIDGKKAQQQLRTAKDRCVKKVKAKEREIANYVNGMFVREREIGTLQEQLKQTQDALNKISEIKENVEGCCAEIQQNLLPEPPLTSDEKKINSEVGAIDKYMSEIDKIITDTKEQ